MFKPVVCTINMLQLVIRRNDVKGEGNLSCVHYHAPGVPGVKKKIWSGESPQTIRAAVTQRYRSLEGRNTAKVTKSPFSL